jgi:hypothetical protein
MYNLLEEKWITVQTQRGVNKVSLVELIEDAHEILDVIDNPIVRVSILRVALSILYEQYQIRTSKQWISLWNKSRFDRTLLDKKKFELFDDKKPFYQSVGVVEQKNAFTIQPHLGGNNVIFFNDPQKLRSLTYEESAKWLITHQMWAVCMPSKGKYLKNSILTGGVVLILEGSNLFETLMLNMLCGDHVGNPIWSRKENSGLLDLLTWRSRSMRLISDNGVVRKIDYADGDEIPEGIDDSMLVYVMRKGEKQKLTLNHEKQLWRNCEALFAAENKDCSLALKQFINLLNMDSVLEVTNERFKTLEKRFSITAMIITNTAKVQHYVYQTFPIPEMFFDPSKSESKRGEIGAMLRKANELSRIIRFNFLKQMNIKAKRGKRIVIDGYLMEYWNMLEVPFMNYLSDKLNMEQFIELCFRTTNKVVNKIVSDYWSEDAFKFVKLCGFGISALKEGEKVDGTKSRNDISKQAEEFKEG